VLGLFGNVPTFVSHRPEGIVVNAAYIEQWKKMKRARRRFVLAVLAFPVGSVVNHYLIDPTNRRTVGVAIFGLGCLSFCLLATFDCLSLMAGRAVEGCMRSDLA